MKIFTAFEHNELEALQTAIIVEMWGKVLSGGRGKREFKAQFTDQEQALIRRYYQVFYKWHLKTGIPQLHRMKVSTYELMKRAVAFFASF